MLPLCIFVPEVDSMPMPTYPGNESDIDSATSDAWTATSEDETFKVRSNNFTRLF